MDDLSRHVKVYVVKVHVFFKSKGACFFKKTKGLLGDPKVGVNLTTDWSSEWVMADLSQVISVK
jgi:hypothetical protein